MTIQMALVVTLILVTTQIRTNTTMMAPEMTQIKIKKLLARKMQHKKHQMIALGPLRIQKTTIKNLIVFVKILHTLTNRLAVVALTKKSIQIHLALAKM